MKLSLTNSKSKIIIIPMKMFYFLNIAQYMNIKSLGYNIILSLYWLFCPSVPPSMALLQPVPILHLLVCLICCLLWVTHSMLVQTQMISGITIVFDM